MSAGRPSRARGGAGLASAVLAFLAGCATVPPPAAPEPAPEPAPPSPSVIAPLAGGEVARGEHLVLYRAGPGDTLEGIAARLLGDASRAAEVAAFNAGAAVQPGTLLAVPLRPVNPLGVYPDGYQTVPILAYHRIGPRPSKMTVTAEAFAAQMELLAREGYTVVPLSALEGFLAGRRALPPKSVVLTFDDGYASTYHVAFPILRRHGFPATVFVYTDFVGARDALTWDQMREMAESGLIDIQAHSKTHANLTERLSGEGDAAYRRRVESELTAPRDLLQRRLGRPVTRYAFPYGDANETVVAALVAAGYRLAGTVDPGGNAFFATPLVMRRTMIFGDRDLAAFRAALQVSRPR